MKKYIVGAVFISALIVAILGAKKSEPINNLGAIAEQDPVSYQYSTELWTKVPLQNTKIELYSAGESYDGATLLATIIFPEKLIRKELATLIGTKKCRSYKGDEGFVTCEASSTKGISITSYPESYASLVTKFNDEVCRWETCSRDISIGTLNGKVFTSQVELEGRNYYLFPSNVNGKTLIANVDFDWNDVEQSKFMNQQVDFILASAKL